MRFFIFIFFFIFAHATICCDGSYSSSSGKGACSHHGGVCEGVTTPLASKPTIASFHANVASSSIYLSWSSSGALYYQLYLKEDGEYRFIAKLYTTHYTYTPLQKRSRYIFKLQACNEAGCSVKYLGVEVGESAPCSAFGVIDGDTLELGEKRYRLYGIDAPESYEGRKLNENAHRCRVDEELMRHTGELAKEHLRLVLQSQWGDCRIVSHGSDSYERKVVEIMLPDGSNLNERLISDGYVIVWEYFIKEPERITRWESLERSAAQSGRGLWGEWCDMMNCLSKSSYGCALDDSGCGLHFNNAQRLEVQGYFAQFGEGAYEWLYYAAGGGVYKLEGLDRDGHFRWRTLCLEARKIGERLRLVKRGDCTLPKSLDIKRPYDIDGRFYRYGKGAFDWLYLTKNHKLYKLEGMSGNYFVWEDESCMSYGVDGEALVVH